jgi:segregation and condensation protein B
METLSIIAYRQPITKSEMEHIRGVSCDYAIQKLLEKDLISISGKSDGPGRPVLYSTSQSFMDYFGIKSVKDLPQLKDLHIEQNEIGSSSEYADSELEDNTPVEMTPEDVLGSEQTEGVEITAEVSEEVEAIVNSEEANEENSLEQSEGSSEIIAEEEVEIENNEDEIPPVMGEEEDLQIPDRKSIFMENQVESTDENISEENSEFRGEADPS